MSSARLVSFLKGQLVSKFLSFTFYMKFNHTQPGVYFNSASFTVSLVCSCLNPFLKFFVKQSFTSKLLMIAFKLCHHRYAEFEFLSHARAVAFYSKAITSQLKLRCGRVAWCKCVLLNTTMRVEGNVHAWNVFSAIKIQFQLKKCFLLKMTKLCQNSSRFWNTLGFMLKSNFSWKLC